MKIGIISTECLLGGLALLILFSYGAKIFCFFSPTHDMAFKKRLKTQKGAFLPSSFNSAFQFALK